MSDVRVARPTPVTDDHDTGPYFEAAGRGVLAVRVCSCGEVSHLPVSWCKHCGSSEGEWIPTSGRGTVLTWTVVTHQVHPGFPVPYTVVMVSLDDHPQVHLFGHLDGEPPVRAGQAARATFEPLDDGQALPQWQLVD
jgi:uncharacterized OB-fold protein